MELWEVFQKLVNKKGAKISDIARDTNIPYTTVDSIIKKKLKDIQFDRAVIAQAQAAHSPQISAKHAQ